MDTEPAPSACDTCPQPGHCCRDFPIHNAMREIPTALEVMVYLACSGYWSAGHRQIQIGYPFIPSRYDTTLNAWRFNCVNLLPDGRCGDYENRPNGPCEIFEPRSDPLCILFEPPDPSLLDPSVELKKVPSEGA
jgi:hypothetical protein